MLLTDAWEDFPNQSMGVTEIDGVNENEEMHITDVRNVDKTNLITLSPLKFVVFKHAVPNSQNSLIRGHEGC